MFSTSLWTTPSREPAGDWWLFPWRWRLRHPRGAQEPAAGSLCAFQRAPASASPDMVTFALLSTRRPLWPLPEGTWDAVIAGRHSPTLAGAAGGDGTVVQVHALVRVVLTDPHRVKVSDLHAAHLVGPRTVCDLTDAILRRGAFPETEPDFVSAAHQLAGGFTGTLVELFTVAAAIAHHSRRVGPPPVPSSAT